jgi:hypothetical protein
MALVYGGVEGQELRDVRLGSSVLVVDSCVVTAFNFTVSEMCYQIWEK